MNNLPKDPVMLLSFTNTQLRDNFANLEEFCKAYIVNENDIVNTLNSFKIITTILVYTKNLYSF